MRQFIAGVILGAAVVVALGATNKTAGQYQIATAYDPERRRVVVVLLNTETQTVAASQWFVSNINDCPNDGSWTILSKP